MPFKVIRNDITKVHANAIVNTANHQPIYASGTDRAVYEAAGSELLLEDQCHSIVPLAILQKKLRRMREKKTKSFTIRQNKPKNPGKCVNFLGAFWMEIFLQFYSTVIIIKTSSAVNSFFAENARSGG